MPKYPFNLDEVNTEAKKDGNLKKSFQTELPAGDYEFVITDSVEKVSQRTGSTYIQLTYAIIFPVEFSLIEITDIFMTVCENKKAIDFGKVRMKWLCEAVGLPKIENTEELHKKRFIGTFDKEKTQVVKYKPINTKENPSIHVDVPFVDDKLPF